MIKPNIILGPPGCGKTTYLLNKVEELLHNKIRPSTIGFMAFTKKAAHEARDRAIQKFGLSYKNLPYFRTLHSFAFQELGMTRSQIMSTNQFKELGELLHLELSGCVSQEDGFVTTVTKDDRLVHLENLARSRQISLNDQWRDAGHDQVPWSELNRYREGLKMYKRKRHLVDYTDLLELYLNEEPPKLECLMIDEAQDLTPLQWTMVEHMMTAAKVVYIAGDDDQAIFKWAGADVDKFLALEGNVTVLDQSYRIPTLVHREAMKISSRISKRKEKPFHPRDEIGRLRSYLSYQDVDLSKGEWLILARNGYMLKPIVEDCQSKGYYFETKFSRSVEPDLISAIRLWLLGGNREKFGEEQRELLKKYAYAKDLNSGDRWWTTFKKISPTRRQTIRSMIDRGEDLSKPPRIKIATIHGAKGGEADNVLLITDVSYKAHQEQVRNPDDEHRVFYVAVTRTRKHLHIIQPQTGMFYKW